MKYGQAIAQLRDIHMPEPVGLFPLPVGWWLAAGLLMCLVGGGYYFTRRYLRRIQRSALQELDQLERRYHTESVQNRTPSSMTSKNRASKSIVSEGIVSEGIDSEGIDSHHMDSNLVAAELSMILKRFAQAQFPENPVMEFHGESWLAFLDRTGGKGEFQSGVGRNLLVWPYRDIENGDVMELLILAKLWVSRNNHRRCRRVVL